MMLIQIVNILTGYDVYLAVSVCIKRTESLQLLVLKARQVREIFPYQIHYLR